MKTRYALVASTGLLVDRNGNPLSPLVDGNGSPPGYAIDASTGLLADHNGNPLGRVVNITVETLGIGGRGVGVGLLETSALEEVKDVTAHQDGVQGKPNPETAAIARAWAYWLEVSQTRQTLDSKRQRIIRNALRLVGEDKVKEALLGLSRSPHHRGENDQRKSYMEVRYALRGIGDESDEERIGKAIAWGKSNGSHPKLERETFERLLDEMRYTHSKPYKPELERSNRAEARLREAGYEITFLDGPPNVRAT